MCIWPPHGWAYRRGFTIAIKKRWQKKLPLGTTRALCSGQFIRVSGKGAAWVIIGHAQRLPVHPVKAFALPQHLRPHDEPLQLRGGEVAKVI